MDISLDQVNWFKVNTGNPETENPIAKARQEKENTFIGDSRNRTSIKKTVTETDAKAIDFYTTYDPFLTTILDKEEFAEYLNGLNDEEKALLDTGYNYYELQFTNHGGLVMPVILEFEYTDGTKEVVRIPAEIWKQNAMKVGKVFILERELVRVTLDPFLETADVDRNNNYWPPRVEPTRFQLYKSREQVEENPMQRAIRAKEREK